MLVVPLLIVRQKDGKVAAFLNMCRHRGGKVEQAASGSRSLFVCNYHGWSYNCAGALKAVPYESTFDAFDHSGRSLMPVRCEEAHGFIWVNLSNDAGMSLQEFLGPEADAQLAQFELGKAKIFRHEHLELDVNWKLILDGATDILHLRFLHKDTVGKLIHTNVAVWKQFGRHGQSYSARSRLADCVKDGKEFPLDWRHFGSAFTIYPNSMLAPTPDHVEIWTVWPSMTDPGKSAIDIRFLVNPDLLTEKVTDRINRSWQILEAAAKTEDFPMEVSIQRNAAAAQSTATARSATFLYGRSEIQCQHLHRQIEKDLTGIAPG